MVNKLRNKFVIVTTVLLVLLFSVFWFANTLYTDYWNEIEIVEMLDWIACSGIFTSYNEKISSEEELIRDITKDESPIAGLVIDRQGNIVSAQVIGKDAKMAIPKNVLEKMCEKKADKKRIGKYYYSYTELNNGDILLVVMNSTMDKLTGGKIMGVCIMLIIGVSILEIIIFRLSRFVTDPAEQTLLREKQFISDAGHELKTPLGAISINAQALELEHNDDIYIKNIVSESQRMGHLLEKLLTLAKLDEQENAQLTKMNLSEICEEMALTYESLAFEKKVSFAYEVNRNVEIVGSEEEMRQLLAILIDNAIKHTECGGSISLRCREVKRRSEITVTNTGHGIPEEYLPHIFERFYTSDKARTKGSFGLGLAIAKSIVERHKGNISVESRIDEKTTFQVII